MLCNGSITIYHREYDRTSRLDKWVRYPMSTASWHGKQAVSVNEKGLDTANAYTVRIPTPDTVVVANGDIVVRGFLQDEITSPSQIADMCRESFVVTSVADNRRGGLPHFRIEGK